MRDDCYYENVSGDVAFLAGIADSLCSSYLEDVCPLHFGIEVDVFEKNHDDITDFSQVIAERLQSYMPYTGGNVERIKKKVDELNIIFEQDEDYASYQLPGFLLDMYKQIDGYVHERKGHDAMSLFDEGLSRYIGVPVAFYRARKGFSVLNHFYYCDLHLRLIEYEDYFIIVTVGITE